MEKQNKMKKSGCFLLVVVMLFFGGRGVAVCTTQWRATLHVAKAVDNWGLGVGAEGTKPTGNVSAEELEQYDTYYVGKGEEKKIYLTFD